MEIELTPEQYELAAKLSKVRGITFENAAKMVLE
jgi:hypothetical protein